MSAPPPLPPPPPPLRPRGKHVVVVEEEGKLVVSPPPPPPPPPKMSPRNRRDMTPSAAAKEEQKERQPKPLWPGRIERERCDWANAVAVSRSSSGSAGVFFVTLADGGTVVVKGSADVVEQTFAARVGAAVFARQTAGLFVVPQVRVIEYRAGNVRGRPKFHDEEWATVKARLAELALAEPNGECAAQKVGKELNRAFFLVMELATGTPLDALGHDARRARALLFGLLSQAPTWCAKSPDERDADLRTKRLLRGIGSVMAFDVLMNNFDRLPLLWENEGNPANLMVDENSGTVEAIDNTVRSIPPGALRERFITSVRNVVASIAASPMTECEAMGRVRQMLLSCTGVDVGVAGSVEMQLGFIRGVADVNRALGNDPTLLDRIKQDVSGLITFDWANVWASGCAAIDIDFMKTVAGVFEAVSARAEEIVQQWPLERNAVVYNASCKSIPPRPARVLVWQRSYVQAGPGSLEAWLTAAKEAGRQMPDFVLCAEHWGPGSKPSVGLDNPFLAEFSRLAARFGCWILPGTMDEFDKGTKKLYNTAVLLGPDGEIAATYRKQRPVSLRHEAGTTPTVVDTQFGRVAILICFDIENQDVLKATLAHKPFLILNPVSIHGQSEKAWPVAVDSMRRKFEHIACSHLVTVARCDHSSDMGSCGSSQVIGPFSTTLAPTSRFCEFMAHVEVTTHNFWTGPPPPRLRTAVEDNTGARYLSVLFDVPWEISDTPPCSISILEDASCVVVGVPHRGVLCWDTRVRRLKWTKSCELWAVHAVSTDQIAAVYIDGSIDVLLSGDGTTEHHIDGPGSSSPVCCSTVVTLGDASVAFVVAHSDGTLDSRDNVGHVAKIEGFGHPVSAMAPIAASGRLLCGSGKDFWLLGARDLNVLSKCSAHDGCNVASIVFDGSVHALCRSDSENSLFEVLVTGDCIEIGPFVNVPVQADPRRRMPVAALPSQSAHFLVASTAAPHSDTLLFDCADPSVPRLCHAFRSASVASSIVASNGIIACIFAQERRLVVLMFSLNNSPATIF